MTDEALNTIEENPPVFKASLKRVADAVETISQLRGDSSLFDNARPQGVSEYQREMYATEDYLRRRLVGLGCVYPTPISISEVV